MAKGFLRNLPKVPRSDPQTDAARIHKALDAAQFPDYDQPAKLYNLWVPVPPTVYYALATVGPDGSVEGNAHALTVGCGSDTRNPVTIPADFQAALVDATRAAVETMLVFAGWQERPATTALGTAVLRWFPPFNDPY